MVSFAADQVDLGVCVIQRRIAFVRFPVTGGIRTQSAKTIRT